MSLLLPSDIANQLNKDLSSNGLALAAVIIPAVQKWAESRCGYPFESTARVEYFSDGGNWFPLHTFAPISAGPTVTSYNPVTNAYDAITATARLLATGAVYIENYCAYAYSEGIKVAYTAGWTTSTFPSDLKQALVELAAQKMIDSENPGQKLKRVTSGQYTEEYDSINLNDVPANILEVVDRYRLPVVI